MTTLSPVHVGDGNVLSGAFEVARFDDHFAIIDLDQVIHAYPHLFSQGVSPKPEEIYAFLKAQGASYFYRVVQQALKAGQIRSQMRDGGGRLLLPGSSLKGSLRTAILREMLQDDVERVRRVCKSFDPARPHEADDELEKVLCGGSGGGRDSKTRTDLLRALAVCDAVFTPEDLEVVQVRVRSPRRGEKLREMDMWIACEAIRPGAKAVVRIGLDEFLLRPEWRGALGWSEDVALSFEWLAKACRKRMLEVIEGELLYFEQRSPFPEIARWLKELGAQVEAAPEQTLFLRLGFGIGWSGMTGEIADPQARLDLLDRYPEMSKIRVTEYDADPGSRAFPKSRRYIAEPAPQALFGFLRLDPVEESRWPPRLPEPERFAHREEESKATVVATKAPARGPFGILAVLQAVRPQEIKGRFDGLLRLVRSLEDEEERRVGLKGLASLVRRYVPSRDKAFYQRKDVSALLTEFPPEDEVT